MKKASIIINSVIFAIVLVVTTIMILGVNFMSRSDEVRAFTAANLGALKYFTADSNILAGIVALIYVIVETRKKELSQHASLFIHCLKLAATSGVTLTMLVTIFFLIPQFGDDWLVLFIDNNLFFHLIVPILSIVAYIFFEPEAKVITFAQSLFGIIPMLVYAVFYTINIIVHLGNGMPLKEYDWYGFLGDKLTNAFIAIPLMLLVTWGITLALWWANKKKSA